MVVCRPAAEDQPAPLRSCQIGLVDGSQLPRLVAKHNISAVSTCLPGKDCCEDGHVDLAALGYLGALAAPLARKAGCSVKGFHLLSSENLEWNRRGGRIITNLGLEK